MPPLSFPPLLSAPFDWQGHRGARGLAPENTVPAFLRALEFPAITTLELDVVISKDLQIVVSHDPWVSPHLCRCPEKGETINIYRCIYEEVRHFDCGQKGNKRFPEQQPMPAHIPTLAEVVREVDRYCGSTGRSRPRFNIEVKAKQEWDHGYTPPPAEFSKLVLEEVRSLGISDRSCLQSFDPRILRELRQLAAGLVLACLLEHPFETDTVIEALGFTPEIISPYYKLATRSLIKSVHQKGMKVIPWTVNKTSDMARLQNWGVDGIITDYPNRIPSESY